MNSILSPSLLSPPPVINGPKVGDILVSCWGYEACIAHWAQVVGVTGKSVKLQYLGASDNHTGPMNWESTPDLNSAGKTVTKRFKPDGNSYRVKDSSFATFYKWDGKPISCYTYH
jgi:hypothetical protein